MKKLRFLIPLLAIIAAITASAASPTASQLVDDAAARLRQAKSVVISFKATGKTPADSYNGTFTLSGNKFAIDAPEAKVWYDGKTQWTWTAASGEVNITEPTVEEVAQVNPYSILSSLRSRYKARYQGNPSQRTVVLTPSMPDPPVARAEITFDTSGYPSLMKLRMASGEDLTLRVTSVKPGGTLPDAAFRFLQAKAPGAEIVDLR